MIPLLNLLSATLSIKGVNQGLANAVKDAMINILHIVSSIVSVTANNSATCHKNSHRRSVNEWSHLCSNKTLFIKQGVEDYRPQLTDPWSKSLFFILIVFLLHWILSPEP